MAFPAEMRTEEAEEAEDRGEFFDSIVDDEDIAAGADEDLIQEREMLEELPLPGRNESEVERKREWLKLPRPARAAIRRMHNQFGHKLKEPLIEILRASNAPEAYVQAAKHFRCADCDRDKVLPVQIPKVAMPSTVQVQPYIRS